MTWRPKNWENPYGSSPDPNVVRPINIYEFAAYETGANAMLEALVNEADNKHIWFGETDSGDTLIFRER